jgi:HrpA-like RNA helicase
VVIVPKRIMATRSCQRLIDTGQCEDGDVGYAIGGKYIRGAKIMFMTAEWFINYYSDDPKLDNAKFVILDEVHERDVVADIAMYMVRQTLASRSNFTVALMSATLDSEGFIAYFQKSTPKPLVGPEITLDDTQHKVTEWHMDHLPRQILKDSSMLKLKMAVEKAKVSVIDGTLIRAVGDATIKLATRGKSVLVFLPGLREILDVEDYIQKKDRGHAVLCMHSSFPHEDIDLACSRVPPHHMRVVLASSIAESSITILGVDWVVDCCISRVNADSDLTGVQIYADEWASTATLVQRRGRAGRLYDGNCLTMLPEMILKLAESYKSNPPTVDATAKAILHSFSSIEYWGPTDQVLAQLFNTPLPHVIKTAGLQLRCIGALKSPQGGGASANDPAPASANDPPSFSDCSLTGLGEMALCLNVGVRRCQLLTLALALGKGKTGILMVACM